MGPVLAFGSGQERGLDRLRDRFADGVLRLAHRIRQDGDRHFDLDRSVGMNQGLGTALGKHVAGQVVQPDQQSLHEVGNGESVDQLFAGRVLRLDLGEERQPVALLAFHAVRPFCA